MLSRLAARLEVLEDRVRRLERQLHGPAARSEPRGGAQEPSGRRVAKGATAPGASRRPRCPGCTLELPPGRRGDTCVWCGFHFSAVQPPRRRAPRSK